MLGKLTFGVVNLFSASKDVINWTLRYCKFGNFRENIIFANGIKRNICDVKNLRQRHDLPISVNDRVILPFHKGFIFTKLRICEVS